MEVRISQGLASYYIAENNEDRSKIFLNQQSHKLKILRI